METQLRIEELKRKLNYYGERYYVDDSPEISDTQYDLMMNELLLLEKKYPQWKTEDSPTQKVGGKALSEFTEFFHTVPLMSLSNAFSEQELLEFDKKIKAVVGSVEYCVEFKIDGLSVALEYKNGIFVTGGTRGDGHVGETITENLKTIRSIPKKLNEKVDLIVRGEVFMSKEQFRRLNEQQAQMEQNLFANPRNAAAGSLRQLDAGITEKRALDIFVFNLQQSEQVLSNSHYEQLNYLESLGFQVIAKRKKLSSIHEVIEEVRYWTENRNTLPFEIDGIVIKVDDIKSRNLLGNTSKAPKWAIAYKFPTEKKETIIKDISVQVGRTGVLTPIAELEPILISGSVVSRATLHNQDYIEMKDIRIGDKAIIQKAGEIIPEVCMILPDKRNGTEIPFVMPERCPECGTKTVRFGEEVAVKCPNSSCPAQLKRRIIHFVSKGAMDIENLGPNLVGNLYNKGLISDVADIYYLRKEDIFELEGFAEKSTDNLFTAIETSKNRDLSKLIFALGIDFVGEKAARLLSEKYSSIYELENTSIDDLVQIPEIGIKTAESIVKYFQVEDNKILIDRLKNAGVNLYSTKKNQKEILLSLEGLKFVLTGTLQNFKRSKAKELIEERGGDVISTVSGATDFVLAGEKAGSKLNKAMSLNVTVISERQFEKILTLATKEQVLAYKK